MDDTPINHPAMTTMPSPRPNWSPETKRWAILGIVALLGALIYYARSALAWLVVAALLAYLLQPIVNWLHEHEMPRWMAAIIALLIAITIIIIIPAILLPMLLRQFLQLSDSLLQAMVKGLELFNDWLVHSRIINLFGFKIDMTGIINDLGDIVNPSEGGVYVPDIQDIMAYLQQAITAAGGVISGLGGWLTSLVGRTLSLLFSFFLMIFYTFYITVDGWKLKPWAKSLIKPEYLPEMSELGYRINRVWHAFFRGQLTLSLVIGGVTLAVGVMIGLPNPLALAIIAGVMEAVPTIGPIIAAIPAVILAMTLGSSVLPVDNLTFAFITIIAYALIQQAENVLIVPRIMGSALELHPMVVLVGVVIGASFAGILGIFLAAPTLATLKVILAYAHAKILDVDPYPIPFDEEQAIRARNRGPTLSGRIKIWLQRIISKKTDEVSGPGKKVTSSRPNPVKEENEANN